MPSSVKRTSTAADDPVANPAAALRAQAVADANVLRALAWAALRDGMPRGEDRARRARSAARAVIGHARRLTAILAKGDRSWTRGLRRDRPI